MLTKFTCIKHKNNVKYHTVAGYLYIYVIPTRDGKPKSKYHTENKNRNKFE